MSNRPDKFLILGPQYSNTWITCRFVGIKAINHFSNFYRPFRDALEKHLSKTYTFKSLCNLQL